MQFRFRALLVGTCALALSACGTGSGGASNTRDAVRVVGSSSVYPFSTAVAEAVTKSAGIKAPVVEATGTGAGMKLFCAGVGAEHPDVANASRRMKKSEFEDCSKNGVTEIVEIQVGLDGIIFAEAIGGPKMNLTPVDIYKALAAQPFGKPNTAKSWSEVNPALPVMPILIYGPPTTSGTRDALSELIMTKGCETDPAMKALKDKDKDAHKKICSTIREDGAYSATGENDNLIVQKISNNPNAIGVFSFAYLEENAGKIKGVPMSGIAPTYATVADFSYPGARPLYIYVKSAHLKSIKGLTDYVNEWAKAWGPDGYLKTKGMVVAPDDVRNANAEIVKSMKPLDPSTLK